MLSVAAWPGGDRGAQRLWTFLSGPSGGAVGAARLGGVGQGGRCGVPRHGRHFPRLVVDRSSAAPARNGWRRGGRSALALPMVERGTPCRGGGSVALRDPEARCCAWGRARPAPIGPGLVLPRRLVEGPTVTDGEPAARDLDTSSAAAGGVERDRDARSGPCAHWPPDLGLAVRDARRGDRAWCRARIWPGVRVMTVERGIDTARPRPAPPLRRRCPAARLANRGDSTCAASWCPVRRGAIGPRLWSREAARPRGERASRGRTPARAIRLERPFARTRSAASTSLRWRRPWAEVRASYDLRYAGKAFRADRAGRDRADPAELRRRSTVRATRSATNATPTRTPISSS